MSLGTKIIEVNKRYARLDEPMRFLLFLIILIIGLILSLILFNVSFIALIPLIVMRVYYFMKVGW